MANGIAHLRHETYAERVEQAMYDLLALVDDGAEYPDALWKVSQRYAVKSKDVQAAYDTLC